MCVVLAVATHHSQHSEAPAAAAARLREMGPLSTDEKVMACAVLLAVTLWVSCTAGRRPLHGLHHVQSPDQLPAESAACVFNTALSVLAAGHLEGAQRTPCIACLSNCRCLVAR